MKSFALALLVIAASATESHYGGYGGYGPGSSHSSPYRRSSSRYSPRPQFSHEIQRPQRPSYPSYRPSYSQSYSQPSYHQPQEAPVHVENPWSAPAADPVTTGWYSPEMQYSPPRIPFKSSASENTFAICELASGTIQFAQLVGKASKYQATLSSLPAGDATVLIRTTGAIADGTDCTVAGDEFNPLKELDKYGNPNPYQDPSRGTIAAITVDGTGAASVAPTDLLQNLTGSDGLLGRSIELTDAAADVTCCVIARDVTPVQFAAPEFYPSNNKRNYGGYGRGYYH